MERDPMTDDVGAGSDADQTDEADERETVSVDPRALQVLGAILYSAGGPVARDALADRLPPDADLDAVLDRFALHAAAIGLVLRDAAGGVDLVTDSALRAALPAPKDRTREVGRAALEVLAVIAHDQPCTRSEVSDARGTEVGTSTLASLQEAGWIAVRRGKRGPNGASLWVTTQAFLEDFGLTSLDELGGAS